MTFSIDYFLGAQPAHGLSPKRAKCHQASGSLHPLQTETEREANATFTPLALIVLPILCNEHSVVHSKSTVRMGAILHGQQRKSEAAQTYSFQPSAKRSLDPQAHDVFG